MNNKKLFLGIGIFAVLVIAIILLNNFNTKSKGKDDISGLTTVMWQLVEEKKTSLLIKM